MAQYIRERKVSDVRVLKQHPEKKMTVLHHPSLYTSAAATTYSLDDDNLGNVNRDNNGGVEQPSYLAYRPGRNSTPHIMYRDHGFSNTNNINNEGNKSADLQTPSQLNEKRDVLTQTKLYDTRFYVSRAAQTNMPESPHTTAYVGQEPTTYYNNKNAIEYVGSNKSGDKNIESSQPTNYSTVGDNINAHGYKHSLQNENELAFTTPSAKAMQQNLQTEMIDAKNSVKGDRDYKISHASLRQEYARRNPNFFQFKPFRHYYASPHYQQRSASVAQHQSQSHIPTRVSIETAFGQDIKTQVRTINPTSNNENNGMHHNPNQMQGDSTNYYGYKQEPSYTLINKKGSQQFRNAGESPSKTMNVPPAITNTNNFKSESDDMEASSFYDCLMSQDNYPNTTSALQKSGQLFYSPKSVIKSQDYFASDLSPSNVASLSTNSYDKTLSKVIKYPNTSFSGSNVGTSVNKTTNAFGANDIGSIKSPEIAVGTTTTGIEIKSFHELVEGDQIPKATYNPLSPSMKITTIDMTPKTTMEELRLSQGKTKFTSYAKHADKKYFKQKCIDNKVVASTSLKPSRPQITVSTIVPMNDDPHNKTKGWKRAFFRTFYREKFGRKPKTTSAHKSANVECDVKTKPPMFVKESVIRTPKKHLEPESVQACEPLLESYKPKRSPAALSFQQNAHLVQDGTPESLTTENQNGWKRFRFKLVLGLVIATILTSILVPILIKISTHKSKPKQLLLP